MVVGIGASAGGLGAFTTFLEALEPDTGMAYVLIQHLEPSHDSLLAELLDKRSDMEVVQVEEPCPIQADHVYVIPPDTYLKIEDDQLVLTETIKDRGMRMPIDFFFRSLAKEKRERAIGIVLTGTGSDGTHGVKEIKASGGLTIAQDPNQAEYDGMPRSAIGSGTIDSVLEIGDMPDLLRDFGNHSYVCGGDHSQEWHEAKPDSFKSILDYLYAQTGYDFRNYKKGTLSRRIQRRLGLLHLENIDEYLDLFRKNNEEVEALFNDLLIGVTRFFRDPETWEGVAEDVIRPLVKERGNGDTIRIWVPGCSSGEEAYTIGMLLYDEIDRQKKAIGIQIFATDLDTKAISIARSGLYPANIGLDLSEEHLGRYFISEGDQYRVVKRLREVCVFAVQNLIADPPFSNLDLISCRNLMIYLDSSVQKKLITLFHFALNPDGSLLLGSSESINRNNELFQPISKSLRIFSKKKRPLNSKSDFPLFPRSGQQRNKTEPRPGSSEAKGQPVGTVELARKVLLDTYAPASILVDSNYAVHYYHGSLGPYLDTPSGEPTNNLFSLLADNLEIKMRALIRQASQEKRRVSTTTPRLQRGDSKVAVHITVVNVPSDTDRELFLVTFRDEEHPLLETNDGESTPEADLTEEEINMLQQLEYELQATREDLQSTVEELETSNEELKASNEEVMSMNEELQSTNEELETSREELQSLNEELSTVNAQLSEKVEELESTNNDLSNLLTSTEIATIFLDTDLRIRRFTPSCEDLFNIIATDEGRPISDLSPRVNDPQLLDDARRVLEKLQPMEKEVKVSDGKWFVRRILPFWTAENSIDGVVITFTDIDLVKQTYRILEDRERQQACVSRLGQVALKDEGLQELFSTAAELLTEALDLEMAKVLKLNPDKKGLTLVTGVGWNADVAEDEQVPSGMDSQAGYTLQANGPVVVEDFTKEKRFKGSELHTRHEVKSGVSMLIGSPEDPWGVLGAHSTKKGSFTVDDLNFFGSVVHILTEAIVRREGTLALEESESRFGLATKAAHLGTHDFDVVSQVTRWDERSYELWGLEPGTEVTFQHFLGGIHRDDRAGVEEKLSRLFDPEGSAELYMEFRVIHAQDHQTRWIAATAIAFFRDGEPYRAVGTHQDITERRRYLEAQEDWAERLEEQVIERTALADKRAQELRQLASQITNAEERARRNVAQVIHDDMQQLLIAAKMRLPTGPDELASPMELEVVSDLLDQILAQARSLVSELSPPVLEDGDFEKALRWLGSHMNSTHRIRIEVTTEGDLTRIEQYVSILLFNVVRELVFNAVKHADTDTAEVRASYQDNMLTIIVQDHGKGFDFAETNDAEDGFGLFSVRERIQAFGGTFKIASKVGEGTTITLKVPYERQDPELVEVTPKIFPLAPGEYPAPRKGESLRVLLVDDHEIVREGYSKVLSSEPDIKIVGQASNGEEAVKQAMKLKPHLILMDISMPKMNGIEATGEIVSRQVPTTIIGLSLHEEETMGEAMRQAGARGYLQKDVAASQLLDTIRMLFPKLG